MTEMQQQVNMLSEISQAQKDKWTRLDAPKREQAKC